MSEQFIAYANTNRRLTDEEEAELEQLIKEIDDDLSVTAYQGPERQPRVWISAPDGYKWVNAASAQKAKAREILRNFLEGHEIRAS